MRKAARYVPQLQDVGDVPGGEDPSDVVEISHIEAAVGAARQGHGGQELVAVSKAVATGAGDASPAPIAHDAPDDGGLLRHKLVLPIPFVQDACEETENRITLRAGRGSLLSLTTELPWWCKECKISACHSGHFPRLPDPRMKPWTGHTSLLMRSSQ